MESLCGAGHLTHIGKSSALNRLLHVIILACLGVLCGCGGGSSGSGGESSVSTTSAGATTAGTESASGSVSTASLTGTSEGCGAAAKFSSGKYTLVSDGVTREFWVMMPSNYNQKKAYPLIVGLHWRDGQATDVYNGNSWASSKPFYGLKALYGESAIFVAPNGLNRGWANTNETDIHFMKVLVKQLQQGLCVDNSHIYATGFSFGGMMSNAIGCEMGDVFRAVAPMSSSVWSGCAASSNKVAAILFHSKADSVVAYQYGEEARDKYVSKNSCTSVTKPVGTNGCVEYQGCNKSYPVVWCGYDGGGHWPTGFAAQEIKTFFDRF